MEHRCRLVLIIMVFASWVKWQILFGSRFAPFFESPAHSAQNIYLPLLASVHFDSKTSRPELYLLSASPVSASAASSTSVTA